MRDRIEIEDIEEMRRREGIDDEELLNEIRRLHVGNFVKLTFLTTRHTFETLPVRITSIRGSAFRGKLARAPSLPALARLRAGSAVTFTAAHIHSLPRTGPAHEQ